MKRILLIGILFLIYLTSNAQNNYRSFTSGNWNDASTWEEEVSGVWINPAPNGPPDSGDGTILISSGHVVSLNTSTSIDELTINVLAQLTIESEVTMTLVNGVGNDIEIVDDGFDYGVLLVDGILDVANGANVNNSSSATVTINGTYQNNDSGASSSIIGATWAANSNCIIKGVTSTSTVFANLNQNFGNFNYNCTNQQSAVSVDFNGGFGNSNLQGNFTITSTGNSTGSLRIIGASSNNTLTIGGNLQILGTSRVIIANGSGTSNTLRVNGHFVHSSSGNFLFCQNGDLTIDVDSSFTKSGSTTSFNFSSGTGNATLNVKGDFTLSSGTITETGSGTVNTINFAGTCNYTGGGIFANSIHLTVLNTGDLNLSTYALSGAGNFILSSGGTLRVGSSNSSGALIGNITNTGTKTYNSGSIIVFNGSSQQYLGSSFPSDVSVTIDNTGSSPNDIVNLNSSLSINASRILSLQNGRLSIGSNILTINGTVNVGMGYLSATNLSELVIGGTDDLGTIPFDAGTTQLKNLTINRTGTATLGSDIEIVNLIDLENGDFIIDDRTLTLSGTIDNTNGTNAGLFSGNSSTSLIIQGTGALGEINFQQTGGNSLGSLTLNRVSGSAVIGNSITINNTLSLTNGNLTKDPTETVTMAVGSTLERQASGTIGFAPVASTSYNVSYLGSTSLTTGLELPTTASGYLNNLTINTSNPITLDKNIDVKGDLIITNGTLNTSASNYNIDIAGNFTNAGLFTANTSTVNYYGTSTQTIAQASYHNLSITGTGLKSLEGNASISSTGTLTLNGGDVDLNGHTFTINNPSSTAIARTSGNIRSENTALTSVLAWNIGTNTSNHSFPLGDAAGVSIPFVLENPNGDDLGTFSVATYPTDAAFSNTPTPGGSNDIVSNGADNRNNTIKRFWKIERSTSGSINVNATFSYPSTDDPTSAPTTVNMQRWNGTSWDAPLEGQTYTEGTPRTIRVPGITSFSPWGGSDSTTILPVDLINFKATLQDTYVNLDWATLSESKSSHFIVERGEKAENFIPVGRVESAGNSSERVNYQFKDLSAMTTYSDMLYYRLKQVDVDGQFKVYPIEVVHMSDRSANKIEIAPNPATTQVSITSHFNHSVELQIYNTVGKLISQHSISKGMNLLNTSLLERGVLNFRFVSPTSVVNKRVIIE